MKKIILTGGGTAGHVTPNLALLPALREEDFEIHYIGSYNGIERRLIEAASIPYDGISSGKLRRYFDLKNFSDPLRVLKGYFEARKLMKKYKPDIVFSKGGFVAVPVVLAAKHYKVPVIIHESDMTPGLANKICIPAASKVCCNFPETLKYLPEDKAVLTGSPIREELLHGDRLAGLQYAHLSADRPVILIIGGSLGSVTVNQAVRGILPQLLKTYQVIHICGRSTRTAGRGHWPVSGPRDCNAAGRLCQSGFGAGQGFGIFHYAAYKMKVNKRGVSIMNEREKIIRLWFDMWLYQKDMGIDDIFAEDVLYTESWCPQYSNRKTVKHWFQEWNTRGKVVVWEIKQFFHKENQTIVEWYFKNGMNNGDIEEFDGISLIEWTEDNKIKSLKEFGCNRNTYNPYQESDTPQFRNQKANWF